MCVNAQQTRGIMNGEVSGSATVRSHRATDSFAGLPLAQAALTFASARHANQYRETDHAPFIAHPIEVGLLLHGDGQPEEVIAAGLLHDTLEKTRTTGAELQRRFGVRIARLVESVSDDPSIDDYESRKHELCDRIAHAGSSTVAIYTADKISKVRELAPLPTSTLDDTTTRSKLAHYRASRRMLRRVAGNSDLVALLDAELDRVPYKPITGTRDGPTSGIAPAKRSKPRPLGSEPVHSRRWRGSV